MQVPIRHGNSGGPVMNAKGEVVGIATQGPENEAEAKGIYNFALLIDQFRDELRTYFVAAGSTSSGKE
jgi:serine protease Do